MGLILVKVKQLEKNAQRDTAIFWCYLSGGITMTEILLLGTFHFMECSIDFYSSHIQKELDLMARKLLTFNPDVIAVEGAIREQKCIDESYRMFDLSDLQDSKKMQNKNLGEIHLFGQAYPITYNNEVIQLAYRLGKMLKHNKIYAIDDDTILNMEVMNIPTSSLKEAMNVFHADMNKHMNDKIVDMYRYYNSDEWSKLNHSIYIQANMISGDNNYAGAEMVTKWYGRNLKIFSNIQRLAVTNKRIFIIYGAGHLQILRDLINADSNLRLVDVNKYL